MKFNQKIKKNQLLYLTPAFFLIPTLSVFSCNNNSENLNNSLSDELNRLNNLKLELNNNQISITEFNSINKDNFLSIMIKNLNPSNYFYYIITDFSKDNNQFKFKIQIIDKENSNNTALSNFFIINFEIKENNEINEEVNRLNQSNNISLSKTVFTIDELNNINEINFINFLVFDRKDNLDYKVIDFNKDVSNKFIFKIEIFAKELNTLKKQTNTIEKQYTIDTSNPTPPITPSTSIEEEINRLNKNLSNVRLINPDITFKELQEINIDNLLPKITGISLDTTNFSYRPDSMNKDNTSTNKKIGFVIRVYDDKTKPNNNTNFTNRIEINFNLIKNDQLEHVSEEYLKNNLVDVYTGGGYDLAKPGSGVDNDDVITSHGPSKTSPSNGVSEYAKSIRTKVFNDTELKQLKNTFSLAFEDYSGGTALGTGWILDYKLTDDGSYPITWYIATNSHVIQNLKIPNDIISPERYEIENGDFSNTKRLIMRRIKTENIKKEDYGKDFGYSSSVYERAYIDASKLKTIFIGNDYLTTSPRMYSKNGIWSDSEEYIDFAVMEVTFDTPEQAKVYTQDYVNEPERHFKYREESILKNYSLKKEKAYSVIGFPDVAKNTPYFRDVAMYSSRGANDQNEPLFPNDIDKFSNLASSPYYNTFNNMTGMFDASLGLSFFGYNYRQAYSLTTWYNSWGLTYPIDYSNLGEGSSGSMLMDDEGYTLGIYFAADPRASIGLAQALYCEGFNYQNKFGDFNLQGYDLIKGGFPNQKISYKDNLRKLYGNNYKTNLFKDGLN